MSDGFTSESIAINTDEIDAMALGLTVMPSKPSPLPRNNSPQVSNQQKSSSRESSGTIVRASPGSRQHEKTNIPSRSPRSLSPRTSPRTSPRSSPVVTAKGPRMRREGKKEGEMKEQKLSRQLSHRISGAPLKFKAAATEHTLLSGWVMVRKQVGKGKKFVWKRRFLEASSGELKIYATEPPINVTLRSDQSLIINTAMYQEDGEFSVRQGEQTLLKLRASNTAVQALAVRAMSLKINGEEDSENSESFLTTVKLLSGDEANTDVVPEKTAEELRAEALNIRKTAKTSGGFQQALVLEKLAKEQELKTAKADESAVLLWSDQTISIFAKKLKTRYALSQLKVQSSEEDKQPILKLSNGEGRDLVLTLPDPLLLLNWIGAITQCDSEPISADTKAVGDAMHNLILDEARSEQGIKRPVSLQVGKTLGFDKSSEDPIPKPHMIKTEMLASSKLPPQPPSSLKEIMANPTLRKFIYKWSRTQYSSENVKFWIACDNLSAMQTVSDKALGLLCLVEDYISSSGEDAVNIGGVLRKKIMKQVATAKESGDEALAALVPGILSDPLQEIYRVIEFDIYPSFSALLKEVIDEKEALLLSPKAAPKKMEKSVRDILHDATAMQEFLLFTSGRNQDLVVFLTLVTTFKNSHDDDFENTAQFIVEKFLSVHSPHFLEGLIHPKQVSHLKDCKVSADMFEPFVNIIVNHIDASLWKDYVKKTDRRFRGRSKLLAPRRQQIVRKEQQQQQKLLKSKSKWYVTSGPPKDESSLVKEGELARVSNPNVDVSDKKVKDCKVTSLITGFEETYSTAFLRPATVEESAAFESLDLPQKTVFSEGVGADLIVSKVLPKTLSSVGVLSLNVKDVVQVRQCFLKTGWMLVTSQTAGKTGYYHYSYLSTPQII